MSLSSKRKSVFLIAGVAILAMVATALVCREQIAERWYIYQLESDNTQSVDHAATQLAVMSSERAIRPLIERLRIDAVGRCNLRFDRRGRNSWTDSAVAKALHSLGEPAGHILAEELREDAERNFDVEPGTLSSTTRTLFVALYEMIIKKHPLSFSENPPPPIPVSKTRSRTFTLD